MTGVQTCALPIYGRTDDWIRKDGENFSALQVARLLQEHGDVSLAAAYGVPCAVSDELVMAALKLRDGTAFFYLRNVNSGHPGSITTVHAGSAAGAFEQLTLLVKESEGGRDLAPGPLAYVGQSGAVGSYLLTMLAERGQGMGMSIATGNEVAVHVGDVRERPEEIDGLTD